MLFGVVLYKNSLFNQGKRNNFCSGESRAAFSNGMFIIITLKHVEIDSRLLKEYFTLPGCSF